jgi:flagellar protein FlaG
MTTGIQPLNTVTVAPALKSRIQTTGQAAAAEVVQHKPLVKLPSRPMVIAPKSVDIHFDPNEMQQTLQSAIRMLNDQVSTKAQGLGFSYDHAIKNPVIVVRNTHTGEVVRQIPSEDVLRIAHKLDALKGILFNEKI